MIRGILLGFTPFRAFVLIDRLPDATARRTAGAAVSACLMIRDWSSFKPMPELLELGSMTLFGGLALYAWLAAPVWSIFGLRLVVDTGLLLIILVPIAVRQPFTLQYAREKVGKDYWSRPEFIHIH